MEVSEKRSRSNQSRWALIAVVVISVVAIYFLRQSNSRQSNKQPRPSSTNPALSPPNAQAALIESKGLQELSSENNVPANTLSPENKQLGEAVMNALQLAGDGKDRAKLQQATAVVGTLIQQHPDWLV